MKMTLVSSALCGTLAFAATGLGAGCAVSTEPAPSAKGEPPQATALSADTVRTETPGSRKLLASIQKSDTQVIRFWEHEMGVVQVEETGDIDRDLQGAPDRGTLLHTNINGLKLVDAYKLLGGATEDETTMATLANADGRLGKLTPAKPSARGGEAVSSTPSGARGGLVPQGLTQCQITTNNWDWNNDIAWFKNTFCGNDSVTCFANANYWWVDSWADYSYENSWFRATGFEGSFCDSANFAFTLKVTGCDSTTIIYPDNFPLAPRHYNTQNWSTGGCTFSADWDAKVSGNSSGLDSQLRLGLAVHRQ